MYGQLDFGNRSAPAMADIDGDGLYEIVVGNQRGGLEAFDIPIPFEPVHVADVKSDEDIPFDLTTLAAPGHAMLRWKENHTGDISVYDVSGKKVLQMRDTKDIVSLPLQMPGLYIVSVHQDGKIRTSRMVIAGK